MRNIQNVHSLIQSDLNVDFLYERNLDVDFMT